MFDVTPDEIARLSDTDLRELVGRLCEAELSSLRLSPAAVTWGGNQTAADGGLDVRVDLAAGTPIEGFVPRARVGYQVKTPDMPRAEILSEMRPAGTIRPSIQDLASTSGAYIIVSSHGSTADSALRSRRNAIREALSGVSNSDQLHTDFYDRTRLATWARRHPGVVTWIKERTGHALVGWRPYAAWSGTAEGVEGEYLLDDKLRLHLGKDRDSPAQPVTTAIDDLRDELARPGKVVRLVGLSGVGKTRFVQALFDGRVGARPLSPSLAVYTNLSDNPDPQPTGLVSDLIASRLRAVVIVDNCPPDLHRRLSDLCAAADSTVSLLTVEYDVRDDQPEATQVVTLDTSSPELIEKLVVRRYPHLSQVDARSIAEVSGGNARIANALAATVERSETISGLSDDDLFQRLFRQRHDTDDALLRAAEVCSLLYSFQGEAVAGDDAELPSLAVLADQTTQELYRHVGELLRRELAQQRGVWRAVLPHAIANRLAARALENIPPELVDRQLVAGGTSRVLKSFSRRLSYLHEHPKAIEIAKTWLAPQGILGDLAILNDTGLATLRNIAPVSPETTLEALERAADIDADRAVSVWRSHRTLLRSIAYEARLFERSVALLVHAASDGPDASSGKDAADTFTSLFTIYLSGTHATIQQRLNVIEELVRSASPAKQSLGLAALDNVLETTHFSAVQSFEFGARSRDYGYWPENDAVVQWYGAALALVERLALKEGIAKAGLRNLVARRLRGLWTRARLFDDLERLAARFAAEGFWREGWVASRETMRYDADRLPPESATRLAALEAVLRPVSIAEKVRAVVLGSRSAGLDLVDMELDGDVQGEMDRLNAIARELGASVATSPALQEELASELVRGGNRVWPFGRGLAAASTDHRVLWQRLVRALQELPLNERHVHVMSGYLAEVWEQDQGLANELLDSILDNPELSEFLTVLQAAVPVDTLGVERLKRALSSGRVPVRTYRSLAFGRTTDQLQGGELSDLLRLILAQPDGFGVALEVLHMQLHSNRSAQREHDPALIEVGREVLRQVRFEKGNQRDDYELAGVVRACLPGPGGGALAAEVARELKRAVVAYETYAFDNDDLLRALLGIHPLAVLDALFEGDENARTIGVLVFDHLSDHRPNPADEISVEALTDWCNRDPEPRYPLAASIITFARRDTESGAYLWSEQAKSLLARAIDPGAVLGVLVSRFRPMSWSGSRAAIIEANARLLESLEGDYLTEIEPLIARLKEQLSLEIAAERRSETDRDRRRDERFE